MIKVCERNQKSTKGMLKLDEGFSGKGNAMVRLEKIHAAIMDKNNIYYSAIVTEKVMESFKNARFFGESETWESFSKQISIIGAIFELFVEFKDSNFPTTSPSVQVYIDLQGNVEVISTHEQILDNQHYIGFHD